MAGMRRTVGPGISFCVVLVAVAAFAGCGGSTGHPDTGYGANQPIPPTEDCVDLCERIASCVVDLCDEDTSSTQFQGSEAPLAYDCESTCTDSQVQSAVTPVMWQCIFTDSCRQVFGEDSCHGMGNYHCQ
jgi:hypothetical protein